MNRKEKEDKKVYIKTGGWGRTRLGRTQMGDEIIG